MSTPEFITFTGADDHTDYQDMWELARMYNVEFGILMSPDRVGTPRYPSPTWIAGLRDWGGLSLSAHICGGYARHCMSTGTLGWSLAPIFSDITFSRMQINGHIDEVNKHKLVNLASSMPIELIMQSRDPDKFPEGNSFTSWLYDVSGGTGSEPKKWPRQTRDLEFVGYAGGLGPHNIEERISILRGLSNHFWIDMESGVRDENDRFSINKCEAVCRAVYGEPQ